jgi:acyl-CoA thioesterase I
MMLKTLRNRFRHPGHDLGHHLSLPSQMVASVSRFNGRQAVIIAALALAGLFTPAQFTLAQSAGPDPKAATIRIVAYGDSLMAGFGVALPEAFPAQLERALLKKGYKVEVINAGVSGDTTAAALARFDWAVPDGVDAAIVELGANDALRGQDPAQAKQNLDTILTRLKSKSIEVLLAGIPAPRNWGDAYVKAFDGMFTELAQKHGTALYPFFLDGVALKANLSLPDGLHPNPQGIAVVVERIMPAVEALIAKAATKRQEPAK